MADDNNGQEVREQDRYLPVANLSRIMKRALPASSKVSKDSKDLMQECVSEFISFITSEASDKVQQEKRKTITGDDVLWAMSTLGFDNYVEPLKVYLAKYRESVKGDKGGPDGKEGPGPSPGVGAMGASAGMSMPAQGASAGQAPVGAPGMSGAPGMPK